MKTILIVFAVLLVAMFVLDAVNRARIRALRERGLYPPEGQKTGADVERLIRLGRKIEAIKLYRELHGVDLKDAKDAVENLARRMQPDARPIE